MPSFRGSVRIVTVAFLCTCFLNADGTGPAQEPAAAPSAQPSEGWLALWKLPFFRIFAPLFQPAPEPLSDDEALPAVERAQFAEPCSVAPLDPITDPAAQQLEASASAQDAVDIANMAPAAAQALDRFESKVAAVGGTIVLKSAYRPSAYQQPLQNVWYKWMTELRKNQEPGCQGLRAQVQDEFLRHHLIETQHPVAISDHTRGLAFDATVDLPMRARLGRRRVSLDSLARLAGLLRPAIAADPVHFKYVGSVNPRAARRVRRA